MVTIATRARRGKAVLQSSVVVAPAVARGCRSGVYWQDEHALVMDRRMMKPAWTHVFNLPKRVGFGIGVYKQTITTLTSLKNGRQYITVYQMPFSVESELCKVKKYALPDDLPPMCLVQAGPNCVVLQTPDGQKYIAPTHDGDGITPLPSDKTLFLPSELANGPKFEYALYDDNEAKFYAHAPTGELVNHIVFEVLEGYRITAMEMFDYALWIGMTNIATGAMDKAIVWQGKNIRIVDLPEDAQGFELPFGEKTDCAIVRAGATVHLYTPEGDRYTPCDGLVEFVESTTPEGFQYRLARIRYEKPSLTHVRDLAVFCLDSDVAVLKRFTDAHGKPVNKVYIYDEDRGRLDEIRDWPSDLEVDAIQDAWSWRVFVAHNGTLRVLNAAQLVEHATSLDEAETIYPIDPAAWYWQCGFWRFEIKNGVLTYLEDDRSEPYIEQVSLEKLCRGNNSCKSYIL